MKNSTTMMRRKPTLALTLGIVILALHHGLVGVSLDPGLGRSQEDVGGVGVVTGHEGGPRAGLGVGQLSSWKIQLLSQEAPSLSLLPSPSLISLSLVTLLVLRCCCAMCTKQPGT